MEFNETFLFSRAEQTVLRANYKPICKRYELIKFGHTFCNSAIVYNMDYVIVHDMYNVIVHDMYYVLAHDMYYVIVHDMYYVEVHDM